MPPEGLISALRHAVQTVFSAVRVLVALTDTGITCSWMEKGQWMWVDADWPEGTCVNGLPRQAEAMADLVADLLLDVGIVGARVELLLPLDLCEWRVLDGLTRTNNAAPLESAIQERLSWRFNCENCFVSCSNCSGSALAVAISRSDLEAWIDVFEQADLSLDRVDWLLSAAYRGMLRQMDAQQEVDLAWMISTVQKHRLILIRDGVPELDRSFDADEPQQWVDVVGTIESWSQLRPSSATPLWHHTGSSSHSLSPHLVAWADRTLVPLHLSSVDLVPWIASTAPTMLDPLISLGFEGLGVSHRIP